MGLHEQRTALGVVNISMALQMLIGKPAAKLSCFSYTNARQFLNRLLDLQCLAALEEHHFQRTAVPLHIQGK